jgi:hypothetical protein
MRRLVRVFAVSCALAFLFLILVKIWRVALASAVSCAVLLHFFPVRNAAVSTSFCGLLCSGFSVSYPRENTAGGTCFWSFSCSVLLHFSLFEMRQLVRVSAVSCALAFLFLILVEIRRVALASGVSSAVFLHSCFVRITSICPIFFSLLCSNFLHFYSHWFTACCTVVYCFLCSAYLFCYFVFGSPHFTIFWRFLLPCLLIYLDCCFLLWSLLLHLVLGIVYVYTAGIYLTLNKNLFSFV